MGLPWWPSGKESAASAGNMSSILGPRKITRAVEQISPEAPTIEPVQFSSVQFSSVTQSCLTLGDPMDYSTSGLPAHHQLLELAQTHVHRIGDANHPFQPLLSPSLAFNLFQEQGLFK